MVAQNADLLVQNQIEKRLPLYSAQKTALSKDIDKFLNEQKAFAREAIPVITSIELDVRKVDDQYYHLNALYKKLALNFSELMSKYMAPLDAKQQKEFNQTLKSENDKMRIQTTEEQLKKIQERFEKLFGSISDRQKQILENQSNHFKDRHEVRLKRREKLHARFNEIFQMDLSNEARAKFFHNAFADYQNNYPESEKNKEIIKSIVPTLTIAQREHFEEKTNEIKEIIGYYIETNY